MRRPDGVDEMAEAHAKGIKWTFPGALSEYARHLEAQVKELEGKRDELQAKNTDLERENAAVHAENERLRDALEYVKRWWDETGRDEGWHKSIGVRIDAALPKE